MASTLIQAECSSLTYDSANSFLSAITLLFELAIALLSNGSQCKLYNSVC